MCIYHNVPLLDYVISAPDPQFFVSQNTDLPIPELDSIGMQSIPIAMYSNSDAELATDLILLIILWVIFLGIIVGKLRMIMC